jgi:hypothetical protein
VSSVDDVFGDFFKYVIAIVSFSNFEALFKTLM